MFQYERKAVPLNFDNMYLNIYGDQQNVGLLLLAMLLWTLSYVPLTWYFEKILPGEFGNPQPFYFPFQVKMTSLLISLHESSQF
jgi:ATP-binding cassette subfamily A (ABC1) protein 3